MEKPQTIIATPELSRWYMQSFDMGLIEITSNTKHAVQWKRMHDDNAIPAIFTLSRKEFEKLVTAEKCNRLD